MYICSSLQYYLIERLDRFSIKAFRLKLTGEDLTSITVDLPSVLSRSPLFNPRLTRFEISSGVNLCPRSARDLILGNADFASRVSFASPLNNALYSSSLLISLSDLSSFDGNFL